ncbi:MAG: 4Fe-4S binding protein [Bacteroidetes bacterium]|nr:4Fe-4S binding protein [Bacteroidota bacterium]
MKREIIHIDDEKCDGCGLCIPNCHEGALQIIDGKARLVSELMCDGLGACIGHCPQGALTIETREADAYDEVAVIGEIIPKGKNTLIAHLKHLKDHGEHAYLKEAVAFLKTQNNLPFDLQEVLSTVHHHGHAQENQHNHHNHHHGGGCPGSIPVDLGAVKVRPQTITNDVEGSPEGSELSQWPVQMHLINPSASYFKGQDLLVAADCVAYAMSGFHRDYLKGKKLVIACPKLDTGLETYVEKFRRLIDEARINTITVMMMEVPCCQGMMRLIDHALAQATRKVPVKALVVSIRGEILKEEWV